MKAGAAARAAFAVAFVAIGLPYWLTPYGRLNLPDSLVGSGLLVAFGGAAVLRYAYGLPLGRLLSWLGLPAPLAVMLRVAVDVWRDPTSHNLWPFEWVIAAAIGFGTAFVGVLAGAVLARLLGRASAGDASASSF